MAVGVVVVHAGLSAVSDCAMGEESESNEWNAGAQNRGRQLRTEAGRKLVGSEGGTCHFGFGNEICMLST